MMLFVRNANCQVALHATSSTLQSSSTHKKCLCRMLPLGESVIVLKAFIATRSVACFGVVCNALAEAMRQVLLRWEQFVCALEHNLRGAQAPIHQMWCHVQPSMALMHFSACASVPTALNVLIAWQTIPGPRHSTPRPTPCTFIHYI